MKNEFILFYLKHLKKIVLFITLFFVLSAWAGYQFSNLYPEQAQDSIAEITELVQGLDEVGPVTLFLVIFFQNVIKSYIFMILGVFFGIIPIIVIYFNGFLLGLLSGEVIKHYGVLAVIASLAPHGVFEIPAFILACSMGWWIGYNFFRNIKTKNPISPYIKLSSLLYWKYLMPFFFLAAIIESALITFVKTAV